MKKSDSKDCDSLILQALEAALACGRPAKLVSEKKSNQSALFPDETGERRKAIERCLDGSPALLRTVRTEVSSSTSPTGNRFVVITPEGVEYLFSHIPLEKASALLAEASLSANTELREIDEALKSLLSARQQVVENVTSLLQQFQRTADDAATMRSQVDEKASLLTAWLERLPIPQSLLAERRDRPPLRDPATEEECLFRQKTAQELVFAWQDTEIAARESMERVLFNLGAEKIGQPGEHTEFSGRLHTAEDPAFPGDMVEIKQSGWLLTDVQGGYLLAPAKVTLISQSKE